MANLAPAVAPAAVPAAVPAVAPATQPRKDNLPLFANAPPQFLRFPQNEVVTVGEITAFLINWIRCHGIAFRFASNGASNYTIETMVNYFRAPSAKGPVGKNAICKMIQKAMRDTGLYMFPGGKKWTMSLHQSQNTRNFNGPWNTANMDLNGMRHILGTNTQVTDVRFDSLAIGVQHFPSRTRGDGLNLTSCVQYAVTHPQENLMFPSDFTRLVNRLGRRTPLNIHEDGQVFARWANGATPAPAAPLVPAQAQMPPTNVAPAQPAAVQNAAVPALQPVAVMPRPQPAGQSLAVIPAAQPPVVAPGLQPIAVATHAQPAAVFQHYHPVATQPQPGPVFPHPPPAAFRPPPPPSVSGNQFVASGSAPSQSVALPGRIPTIVAPIPRSVARHSIVRAAAAGQSTLPAALKLSYSGIRKSSSKAQGRKLRADRVRVEQLERMQRTFEGNIASVREEVESGYTALPSLDPALRDSGHLQQADWMFGDRQESLYSQRFARASPQQGYQPPTGQDTAHSHGMGLDPAYRQIGHGFTTSTTEWVRVNDQFGWTNTSSFPQYGIDNREDPSNYTDFPPVASPGPHNLFYGDQTRLQAVVDNSPPRFMPHPELNDNGEVQPNEYGPYYPHPHQQLNSWY